MRHGVDRLIGRRIEKRSLRRRGRSLLCREQVAGRNGSLRFALLRGSRLGLLCGLRGARPQLGEERAEAQLAVRLGQPLRIGSLQPQLLGLELDGHVEPDRSQPLGQHDLVSGGLNVDPLLAREKLRMGQQVLDGAELADELDRALLADALHTRNIVRRVAPQRKHVDHATRIVDAVMLAYLLAADDLDAVGPALALFVNPDRGPDQLPVVLVGRYHEHLVTCGGRFLRQRADHVVGFVAGNLEHRNAHRLEHLLDIRNRRDDVFGRLAAVGLVVGVELVTEIASRRIERHAEVMRPLAQDQVLEELDEPEHGRRIHAGRIAHRPSDKSIVETKNQCVGIDQKNFLHKPSGMNAARTYLPLDYAFDERCFRGDFPAGRTSPLRSVPSTHAARRPHKTAARMSPPELGPLSKNSVRTGPSSYRRARQYSAREISSPLLTDYRPRTTRRTTWPSRAAGRCAASRPRADAPRSGQRSRPPYSRR